MNIDHPKQFERLIKEAAAQPFSGWDFSWLGTRWRVGPTPWNYRVRVREAISGGGSLLDLGTGGGEVLASLAPLPVQTWATEAFAPNIPVAKARLEPLGVRVISVDDHGALPFDDGQFDTVIDRHEEFVASEVARILCSGGLFITQQVGEKNNMEINEWLGGRPEELEFTCEGARSQVEQAGLEELDYRESLSETVFDDVGAVVFYLRAVPWQVAGFTVEGCRGQLMAIHNHIQRHGGLTTTSHHCYLEARKP